MYDIDDFNKAKKELHREEIANDIYNKQKSVMSAVLDLIPFLGAFVDELTEQNFDNYQSRKRARFVEVVLRNTDLITSDKVSNEACIVNIAKTIELVDRCASADKVVYYGNLVRNGYFNAAEQISNDDFDEYEAILNELSEREINYLVIFAEYARKNNRQLSGKSLNDYLRYMQELYPNISATVVLNRLQRTGFVTDEMAWINIDEEENLNNNLQFGAGNSYVLDCSYDDFERIVLKAFDEGKRK